MTKEVAISYAKEIDAICCGKTDGYIIIESVYNATGLEYDVLVFDSYDEMKRFIQTGHGFDYLDDDVYLYDDERIVSAFSKSHLIIL